MNRRGKVVAILRRVRRMSFIQVIEFRTTKVDEMREVGKQWETAAGGDVKARRRVLCADRVIALIEIPQVCLSKFPTCEAWSM